MKPPTTPARDIFGAECNGTPGHQRVLKPPGGGSSDIFGTGEEGGAARRVQKNHNASNVFLSDEPAPSTPARSPGNSHSRLFGPASPPKSTPRPNRSVSKILPLDSEGNVDGSNGNSPLKGVSPLKSLSPSKSVTNGDSHDAVDTPMTNGNSSPTTNGNRITNGGSPMTNGGAQAQAPASRNRVPPGGYSSGLW